MHRKRSIVSIVAALLLLTSASVAEAARCITKIAFWNIDRQVPGPVTAECGGARELWLHSQPFGNWGVESPWGLAHDGYQFSGWYADDGWRQWNSCTTKPEFRTPEYLPHGEPQLAKPNFGNLWARTKRHHRPGRPCTLIHRSRTYVVSGVYMRLFELDTRWDQLSVLGDGPDFVTSLWYRPLVVRLTCRGQSCRGQSAYKWNRFSNRPARARVGVTVTTEYR